MKTPTPWTLAAASLVLAISAHAENWPQWRGPALDGTSPEKGLPETWTKESVKWATPLPGPSGATPAVWGDTIFLSSPDAEKNLNLLAISRKDGAVKWTQKIAEGDINKGKGNMASPSPVTDGKTVWALFGTGDLVALDFTGKVLWKRQLGDEYGRFAIMWLYGSSPLLFDGRLYIQVLQRTPAPPDYPGMAGGAPERESYLLALEPATGKTIWKVTRPSEARMESLESYATPQPHIAPDGSKQLLVVGGNCLTGHDLATGKELWRGYGLNSKDGEWMRIVPSPVSAAGLAIAAGPKKGSAARFQHGQKGRHHRHGAGVEIRRKEDARCLHASLLPRQTLRPRWRLEDAHRARSEDRRKKVAGGTPDPRGHSRVGGGGRWKALHHGRSRDGFRGERGR